MPSRDDEFYDIEAMIAAGYTWTEWYATPPVVRGRLRAHFVEKAAHEAYEMAAMDPRDPNAKKDAKSGYDGMMGAFFSSAPK